MTKRGLCASVYVCVWRVNWWENLNSLRQHMGSDVQPPGLPGRSTSITTQLRCFFKQNSLALFLSYDPLHTHTRTSIQTVAFAQLLQLQPFRVEWVPLVCHIVCEGCFQVYTHAPALPTQIYKWLSMSVSLQQRMQKNSRAPCQQRKNCNLRGVASKLLQNKLTHTPTYSDEYKQTVTYIEACERADELRFRSDALTQCHRLLLRICRPAHWVVGQQLRHACVLCALRRHAVYSGPFERISYVAHQPCRKSLIN